MGSWRNWLALPAHNRLVLRRGDFLFVLPQAFQAFDIDINRYDRYPLGQIKSDFIGEDYE